MSEYVISEPDYTKMYYIVRRGTNERRMLPNEPKPLILDRQSYAQAIAQKDNCVVMSISDFINKFGYL